MVIQICALKNLILRSVSHLERVTNVQVLSQELLDIFHVRIGKQKTRLMAGLFFLIDYLMLNAFLAATIYVCWGLYYLYLLLIHSELWIIQMQLLQLQWSWCDLEIREQWSDPGNFYLQ